MSDLSPANATDITKKNSADNQFWLQIMGDHTRFILNALSPKEPDEAKQAERFIALLDGLLARSKEALSDSQLKQLNQDAYQAAQEFRKFVLHLIRRQISEKLILSLRPSFLNHIVNDSEQYLDRLSLYINDHVSLLGPAGVSLVWLLNTYINALTIEDGLDATAFDHNKQQAREFANTFLDLYFKAYVMNGLRRSGLNDFPALSSLNDDIEEQMIKFAEYIVDLITLMENRKVLGNITLLYLDNFYRQLCYYMTELSGVSKVKIPVCDPASPRRE
jgi:hypothetical protein